jgi:hypothetical protein
MRIMLLGLLGFVPALAVADGPGVDDRFAAEPNRPKAESPVRFGRSWIESRAEASRSGRRTLVVFTGDRCGWCRVLEKRTFTDAEVVALSREFVCVELNTGDEENARLVDEYRIDSIPRSLILDAEGRTVTKRTGYFPAAEYADWLKDARTRAVASIIPAPREAVPPAAVGVPESEANVVIWSVDSARSVARWNDDDWSGHPQLLQILRAAGLRPRVEHMARDRFPARWDESVAAGHAPEIVVADQFGGLIRDLVRKGSIISIGSDRLSWTPENASCPDFAGRSAFLVVHPRHEDAAPRALDALLRPGPDVPLPGAELADSAGRVEAEDLARRTVAAFLGGDPAGLKSAASADSPQLTRCVRPEEHRLGCSVTVGSVELRGNACIAFARVEARWQGPNSIGADPVLAVLRREGSGWKAFAVSADIVTLRELPALCQLELREAAGIGPPTAPRLLEPADGAPIGVDGRSFAWEVASNGPMAAQICQVLLDSDEGHDWPETRLKVEPGTPAGHALTHAEAIKGLTGVTSPRMYWCVWAVSQDGRIAVSDVRRYLWPKLKF